MADWDWIKEIGVPGLTGVLGVLGTMITLRSKRNSDREQQELQRVTTTLANQTARDTAQMGFDAATAATLTERFKALMDGYEHRIDDLTREGRERLARIERLETQFNAHRLICNENDCDTYRRYMRDHPNVHNSSS